MPTHNATQSVSSTKQAETSDYEARIHALEAALHSTQMQLQLEREQHTGRLN